MKMAGGLYRVSDYFHPLFNGQPIEERDGELHILNGEKVWLISDLHFGHNRIIPWCRADSFITIDEMHRVLIKNWNSLVSPADRVICVGDFGRLKYRLLLKGQITMIQGNHDKKQWDQEYILRYRNTTFLVVHDPDTATRECQGEWIIHGHTHHTTPFIDIHRKRVNVSCEALQYRPITMEHLYSIVNESERYTGDRWVI